MSFRRRDNMRVVFFKSRRPSSSSGYLIAPSASWDGTLTWSGRTPPTDPTRTTFKPAARFAIPPYQDVTGSTGEFTIPLLAYCRGGIASVHFWCEGNTVAVTEKTKITEYDGRPFEAYRLALNLSDFPVSTNGPIQIYATVNPVDSSAQARVVSLQLYRDSGTAGGLIRYVSPTGNDTTGDGTEGNPYLTITAARNNLRTFGDVGGDIIYLEAGTYLWGNASAGSLAVAAERWMTVMPKPGVSRDSVIINGKGSASGLRCDKLKGKDLTFDQVSNWALSNNGTTNPHFWLDNCIGTGPGRTVDSFLMTATYTYFTDCDVTDYSTGYAYANLTRNSNIGTIAEDAFTGGDCVVCCQVDEQDPTATLFHADFYQLGAGSTFENKIVYGSRGSSTTSAQGLFCNGQDTTTIRDLAFVNNLVNTNGNSQFSDVNISHVLLYNNNFQTSSFLFRDNDAVDDNTWAYEDYQQNIFELVSPDAGAPTTAVTAAMGAYNHFVSGTSYGTSPTTGAAEVDAAKTPNTSQLRPAGTSRLLLMDYWGNDRPATGTAVGPIEDLEFPSAYINAVMADSPIAWYRLDEAAPSGAGSVLDYSSGGTYDGTPAGTNTWNQVGPLSDGTAKSVLFNGTDGKVTCGSTIATDLMTSANWTIELWCYSGRDNGGHIFGAAAGASQRVAIQHFNNIISTSSTVGGNKSSGSLGLTLQTVWHHVVLRSDGVLYVDGVERVGTATASLASTVAATIGCRNDSTAFFQGRVSHVSLYNTLLSPARILVHHSTGVASKMLTGRNFYWDFEQNTPNVFPAGSDDVPAFDQSASLSAAQAYAGTQSGSFGGGTFRSIQFNNQTDQHKWSTPAEGRVRCRLRYNGTVTEFMGFMLSGKDRSGTNDTNDAVQFRFTPTEVRLFHISEGGSNSKSLTPSVSLAADTWHEIIVRWRTTGATNLSITVNGTEYTSTQTLGVMSCTAFHHLLIGNDRNSTPTGLWVDEFEVFGSWDGV